ncbi:hypothetical protein V8C44DRAFT_38239 [Trichoderma aethiopicum]
MMDSVAYTTASVGSPATVKLELPSHWVPWLHALRSYAITKGIWSRIDPELDEQTNDLFQLGVIDPATEEVIAHARTIFGIKPTDEPSSDEKWKARQELINREQRNQTTEAMRRKANSAVQDWIIVTVNTGIY